MSDTNVHRVVGNLLVGTSHFFVDTTTNQVGVNTSTPGAALDVQGGDVKVGSGITLANNGTITATGFSGNGSGLSGVNSDSGSWVNGSSSNIHLAVSTDNVGIGVLDPSSKLDVNGDINIATGSTLKVGGTPAVFSNWTVHTNGSDIYRSSGNVGIGVTPGVALDVAGTIRGTGGIITGTSDTVLTVTNTTTPAILRTLTTGGQVYFQSGTAATSDSRANINFTSMYNGTNYLTIKGSTGNVGIGMTSPEDKLHTDNIRIGDWIGSGNGFRFSMDTNAYLRIQYMTGQTVYKDIMALRYDTGNVGIGTTIPYAKLHVNGGSGAIAIGWRKYFKWNDPGYGGGSLAGQSGYGWGTHGIYASEAIVCGHYFVSAQGAISSSDERIKKDIVDVEDGKALDIIRELKPKKYRYKDEINRGVEPVWGFIAQEVNDILPEAVKIDEECLPNIYEMANVSSNVITFTNFDTSTLESNASVLKVFDEDDNEHLLTIDKVIDEHSIRVKEDRTESQLFIYGQRVNDFHRIRKETVWTVATAALQEVDRQLQTEKAELSKTKTDLQTTKSVLEADLQTTKEDLQTTRTELADAKTDLEEKTYQIISLEARLAALEQKFISN